MKPQICVEINRREISFYSRWDRSFTGPLTLGDVPTPFPTAPHYIPGLQNAPQYPEARDFEVGGGGGQTSPGVQGNSYQKLKTPRISPTIFFRATQGHVQTNKNKNERHRQSKVGGVALLRSKS